MNSWTALLESYQQRVYRNIHATVTCQIQQVDNPMAAVVMRVNAAHVDYDIVLDYLTCNVACEKPDMESTDPKVPIDNSGTDDQTHFRMPSGSVNHTAECEESIRGHAIPTTIWHSPPTTELDRFDLGTSDVAKYEGEDDAIEDADKEEDQSQAINGSTNDVED
jgi:hypothetical protein